MTKKIGVLALQGDFTEHKAMLRKLGAEAPSVRLPRDLNGLDGLVIPGGESTTIGKLMQDYKLIPPISQLAHNDFPIMGTCAGMIVLSRKANSLDFKPIGAIDIDVERNAFGRQTDSFETDLSIPVLGAAPFHTIFIRAPLIIRAGDGVNILAKLPDGKGATAQQGKILVSAFHPELTDDIRLHRYFLNIVTGAN
ncbi:MAG: pyridoxal 5'-phosphate synthase glutaminase subunit PdxT [Dehalococcoidia bacterium]|nr:pyridoxal 5'-phosphate synthase glutaminase subunit PdxT [Dehalococcoidia bacterium]